MQTQVNQSTEGVELHDVVTITIQGHKHSWYNVSKIGIVIRVGVEGMTVKLPDGQTLEYKANIQNEDGEWLTIEKASEFEYMEEIKKEIEKKEDKIKEIGKEKENLNAWLQEYQDTISFFGKLKKFVKDNTPWKK